MQGKYKRLLSDTFLFTVSNFASKVISFLLIPLYTSVLSTTDYGISDLIQTTVNFLYPFLTLSISEATIRFAFERETRDGNVLTTSLLFIIISTLILILASPLIPSINRELGTYWIYFLIYYFCYNIHYCLSQYTRGCEKVKLFAVQGIIQTIVVISSNIIMLLVFRMGIRGYLLSFIIGYLVAILLMLIKGRYWNNFLMLKFDINLIKEMLKYSIPMIPTQAFWWINNAADKWIIIAKIGISENGVYSVAHKIPTILTMITAIFNQAWQVSAFSNYGKKDNSQFFSNVYSIFVFINMLLGTLLIAASELIGRILFSNEFYRGWIFVPILLIASIFNGLSGMLASAFTSAKKTNVLFFSTGIGAIVNIILNVLLIDRFHSLGAAYATSISCMVVWIIRIIQTNKYIRIQTSYIRHIISFVLIVFQGVLSANQIGNIWAIGALSLMCIIIVNQEECRKIQIVLFQNMKKIINRNGRM